MTKRENLLKIFLEKEISFDTILALTNSMRYMTDEQKEERSSIILKLIYEYEDEDSILE